MMEETNPVGERCLTAEERRELAATWERLQAALHPMGAMIEQEDEVDCDELYAAFLHFSEACEAFERAVMRAKQIRLLHAGHSGQPM